MKANMSAPVKMLINGELVLGENKAGKQSEESGSTFEVINPSSGKAVELLCPFASPEQAEAAVNAAHKAWPAWAALDHSDRVEYMKKATALIQPHIASLAKLLVQEQGKSLKSATGEVMGCMMLLGKACAIKEDDLVDKSYPDANGGKIEVRRVPLGVVAGITPWNYPLFCSVQKWAPALVLGNTFVLKPSPMTPLTSLLVGTILAGAFPKGVLNVIAASDADAGKVNIGKFLCEHPKVSKVSFTGSVATGKKIMSCAPGTVKRMTLEMGGNDAAIVRGDCDVKATAKKVFQGAFTNTGQVCCAIKRCYVHESIFDEFAQALASEAEAAKKTVGDGLAEGVAFGPLNNEMQFERVKMLVEDAVKSGGKLLAGGKVQEQVLGVEGKQEGGYFYEPTIVSGVKEGVKLVDEEQFGPVLPVMPYKTDSEAVARANGTDFGLGASVWSKDPEAANKLAGKLRAGTVWVNDHLSLTGAPFGGFKTSGMGRELGKSDLAAYTESQTFQLAKTGA